MNKEEVIQKVKELQLPNGSYIVYGAASFAVYGIRDVNDVDMLVTEDLYKELEHKGWKKVQKGPDDEPVTHGLFEAHKTWDFSPYAPTLEKLLSRAVKIEGIAFASLEDIRKWKHASGRPKDLKDLELIKKYSKSPQS